MENFALRFEDFLNRLELCHPETRARVAETCSEVTLECRRCIVEKVSQEKPSFVDACRCLRRLREVGVDVCLAAFSPAAVMSSSPTNLLVGAVDAVNPAKYPRNLAAATDSVFVHATLASTTNVGVPRVSSRTRSGRPCRWSNPAFLDPRSGTESGPPDQTLTRCPGRPLLEGRQWDECLLAVHICACFLAALAADAWRDDLAGSALDPFSARVEAEVRAGLRWKSPTDLVADAQNAGRSPVSIVASAFAVAFESPDDGIYAGERLYASGRRLTRAGVRLQERATLLDAAREAIEAHLERLTLETIVAKTPGPEDVAAWFTHCVRVEANNQLLLRLDEWALLTQLRPVHAFMASGERGGTVFALFPRALLSGTSLASSSRPRFIARSFFVFKRKRRTFSHGPLRTGCPEEHKGAVASWVTSCVLDGDAFAARARAAKSNADFEENAYVCFSHTLEQHYDFAWIDRCFVSRVNPLIGLKKLRTYAAEGARARPPLVVERPSGGVAVVTYEGTRAECSSPREVRPLKWPRTWVRGIENPRKLPGKF